MLYYKASDTNKLKFQRIKYLAYGITILVLSTLLFILEMIIAKNINIAADTIFSIAMFINMGLSVIFIIKFFIYKPSIKAKTIYNFKNTTMINGVSKTKFTWLKVAHLICASLNISEVTLFVLILNYWQNISAYEIICLIISVVLFITVLLSFIFLDDEPKIYDLREEVTTVSEVVEEISAK